MLFFRWWLFCSFWQINSVIICHDFFPPLWRGRHIKLEYTRTTHTPFTPYQGTCAIHTYHSHTIYTLSRYLRKTHVPLTRHLHLSQGPCSSCSAVGAVFEIYPNRIMKWSPTTRWLVTPVNSVRSQSREHGTEKKTLSPRNKMQAFTYSQGLSTSAIFTLSRSSRRAAH